MIFGKINDEPNSEYHAADVWSNSKLRDFVRQPQYAYRKHVEKSIAPEPFNPGRDLLIGLALHSLVEGGISTFTRDFAVNRQFKDWRTDAAKAWRSAQNALGKRVLDTDDLTDLLRMHASICANPDAAALLIEGGEPEVTFRLGLDKFAVQCRTDRWHDSVKLPSLPEICGPTIAEIKSTASVSAGEFTNFQDQFQSLEYYRQAALYREVVATVLGLERLPELFYVALENSEPFSCVVFRPEESALNLARREIMETLLTLRRCYETGVWPGAPTGILPVGLKRWFVQKQSEALALRTSSREQLTIE